MSKVIILGALSAIAEATARIYAARGDELVLVARSADRLQSLKADLSVRGARLCEVRALDLSTGSSAVDFPEYVGALGGSVDAVFLFYGVLGDARTEERDIDLAQEHLRVNFSSAAGWCLAAANQLEKQERGVLIVASSVAGDRGRQSNYIYGAAKAGLTVLVQGIAHRLAASGARAVAVKLGFVDSPMTAHIARKGALWAKPAHVAEKLVRIADRRGAPVVYVPSFWRAIMFVVRSVPAPIFHKTKL
jgi:short-subunit dehydrogenase